MSEAREIGPTLDDYPARTHDKVRYADTDRQGHVNGAAFAIASLHLDFRSEIRWPGEVAIGTRVARVGRSSLTLEQGLFQNDVLVATAETVIVQMDETTRRSRPLTKKAVARLRALSADAN